jgi:cystathionine beta-lyase
MSFDFDTVIDRAGTWAAKWDHTMAAHGQPAPAESFVGDGPPPISMSVADMEFAAPPCVIEAMHKRIDHGIFGYTTTSPDYREAVAAWQQARHGWTIAPEWVGVHHGVIPTLYTLIRNFVPEGSGILLQTPAFPPFFDAITSHGCTVVTNQLLESDGRYAIDFDAFEESCARPDVTFFILCNPHNPVGRCFTPEELTRMAQSCARHDVMVFADEIHGDLILPGHRLTPFLSVCDGTTPRVVTANGLSKTMNLAGLQLSNVVIPDAGLREAYEAACGKSGEWGLNPISKAAFMAGFREGGPWLDTLLAYVAENMELVHRTCAERLPELAPVRTEGTYLQWIDTRGTGLDEADLIGRLLSRARIRVEAGSAFGAGGEGFIRVNLACPRSVVTDALERIERALRANA